VQAHYPDFIARLESEDRCVSEPLVRHYEVAEQIGGAVAPAAGTR
jgi:hypothetical protein